MRARDRSGMWGRAPSAAQRWAKPRSLRCRHSLLLRRRRPKRAGKRGTAAPAVPAEPQKPTAPAKPYNSIENIAEFFASRGKKFTVPKTSGRRAHRKARLPPRPESSPSQIWRRHGLPARRRRRRSQDYCTISSLRLEEAGGEVRAIGARLERQSGNFVIG